MASSHPKRRSQFPRPRLQLRLIGAFAGLSALSLLAQTLFMGAHLTSFARRMPTGGGYLAEELPAALGLGLVVAVVLLLPALLLIGVRVTFRIAGPLYRMERHLEEVAGGQWSGPCRIRRTDDLQEFCGSLNAALESARDQGRAEGLAEGLAADRSSSEAEVPERVAG